MCTIAVLIPKPANEGSDQLIDRLTGFFETTVSGDIDVTISYDGLLLVDGREVTNIFDQVRKLNERLLDEVDTQNSQATVITLRG